MNSGRIYQRVQRLVDYRHHSHPGMMLTMQSHWPRSCGRGNPSGSQRASEIMWLRTRIAIFPSLWLAYHKIPIMWQALECLEEYARYENYLVLYGVNSWSKQIGVLQMFCTGFSCFNPTEKNSIPTRCPIFELWRSISRDLSPACHSLPMRDKPVWQEMSQTPINGITQPMDIEEESQSPTMNRQWLKKLLRLLSHINE